jgi:hypothetical protein
MSSTEPEETEESSPSPIPSRTPSPMSSAQGWWIVAELGAVAVVAVVRLIIGR